MGRKKKKEGKGTKEESRGAGPSSPRPRKGRGRLYRLEGREEEVKEKRPALLGKGKKNLPSREEEENIKA